MDLSNQFGRWHNLFACLAWVLLANTVNAAEGDQNKPKTEAEKSAEQLAEEVKQERVGGESLKTDYIAKYFSMVVGGVAFDQFDTTPILTTDDPPVPAFTTEGSPRLELTGKDTSSSAFIEAGFRYRWAWLDRTVSSHQLASIEAAYTMKINSSKSQAEQRTLRANQLSFDSEYDKTEAELTIREQAVIDATGANASAKQALAMADASTKAALQKAATDAQTALDSAKDLLKETRKKEANLLATHHRLLEYGRVRFPIYSIRSRWMTEGARVLVPSDWSIRMGYAFGKDTDRSATAVAGSSDMYAEVDIGWDLARWSFPTAESDEVPIRGSVGLELGTSMTTNESILDVHGRDFLGLAFAVGVPIGPETSEANAPIAEIMARLGRVRVETPDYLNRVTSEVATRNGFVDFETHTGWGLDVEMNIPLSHTTGYLMLRGKINRNYDPNPWSITIGYTVPIQQLFTSFRGQ